MKIKMRFLITSFILLVFTHILSANEKTHYRVGHHYDLLKPAYNLEESDKSTIHEFFSYSCLGCALFEPVMQRIKEKYGDRVEIIRVPAAFYPQWEVTARAYYTAEAMGLLEKSHALMFAAIHQHKKKFRSIIDVADWYKDVLGVDKEQFLATAQSFVVDHRLRQAKKMIAEIGVAKTPTLMINGQYLPKNANLDQTTVLNVVDYLLEKSDNKSNK